MSTVSFKKVNKVYENGVQAVFDFNLEVKDKEFIVFVGPSGCGKSTTLRMLAGLEDITAGEILIDGKVVNDVMPKDRDIAMVFQSYALYPHMTVYENMAFALKIKHLPKEEIEKRVNYAADILALKPYLDRKPKALSGGQRQRVALGRAIVRTPKVFLMDEPLSNLDAKLRVQMRSEISNIHQKVGAITVYVTHDQTEAMTMADRIVVMKDGVIQQIGTPREVYNYPENIFVAGFIGSPSMNFLNGYSDTKSFFIPENGTKEVAVKLPKDKVDLLVKYKKEKIKDLEDIIDSEIKEIERLDNAKTSNNKETKANETLISEYQVSLEGHKKLLEEFIGKRFPICLGVRPEDMVISEKKSADLTLMSDFSELLGHESIMYAYANGQRIIFQTSADNEVTKGNEFSVNFEFNKTHLFDTETSFRIR